MPTYAYACTTCDHRFEAQQAFTDDALTECPECTGRLRKLFNAVGIVFKGSGFYRTDSRGGSPASAKSDRDSGGSADSSGAKGDSATSPAGSKTSDSKTSDSKASSSKTSGSTTSDAKAGSSSSGSSTATSAA